MTPATASGHLAKLVDARLLEGESQGRHRYYRLASAEVARMLESMMAVAPPQMDRRRVTPRVPHALREARTCYDHLAGRVAVTLADALAARGAILFDGEAGELTDAGCALLSEIGVALDRPPRSRRVYLRPCLDWSERRPHLGGHVGAALFDRLVALDWLRRTTSRAVTVTPEGRLALARSFGCRLD